MTILTSALTGPTAFREEKIKTGTSTAGKSNDGKRNNTKSRHLIPVYHGRDSNFSAGYTLIELIVVVSLISIMLFFSVPRFRGAFLTDQTHAVSRWILGTVQSLKTESVSNQKHYILHVDLDAGKLWVSDVSMSEEALEDAENKGFELPAEVKVMDVEYPAKGKVAFGRADISFYKQGYSDRALIHIEDDNNVNRSFLIETFFPKARLYEAYVAFEDL